MVTPYKSGQVAAMNGLGLKKYTRERKNTRGFFSHTYTHTDTSPPEQQVLGEFFRAAKVVGGASNWVNVPRQHPKRGAVADQRGGKKKSASLCFHKRDNYLGD